MKTSAIAAVLDWPRQQADFEEVCTLRDIYVQNASIDDWQVVLAMIFERDYQARLLRGDASVAMPSVVDYLFDHDNRYLLCFRVGGIGLNCHFFSTDEIELSFGPEEVTEATLPNLLRFMIDLGDVTKKPVLMTHENSVEAWIFTYLPDQRRLQWNAASS